MKLVIDIDGVLADFVYGITQKIHELDPSIDPFGTHEQKSWDFRELPKGLFTTAFAAAAADAENFNATLSPLVSNQEINRLAALSEFHEVYYATNRPGGTKALAGTRAFLEQRLGLYQPNIVLTAKKGEFAASIEATHLIDDKAGNAVFAAYHSKGTKVFLLDRPYNRFDQSVLGTKVTRVSTFTEFLDAVTAVEK